MLVMEEKPPVQLFNVAEVAQMLRTSERAVGDLLRSKRLVGFKVGKEWRIEYADVIDFIEREKHSRGSKPEDK